MNAILVLDDDGFEPKPYFADDDGHVFSIISGSEYYHSSPGGIRAKILAGDRYHWM